jgi:hypothetical protein
MRELKRAVGRRAGERIKPALKAGDGPGCRERAAHLLRIAPALVDREALIAAERATTAGRGRDQCHRRVGRADAALERSLKDRDARGKGDTKIGLLGWLWMSGKAAKKANRATMPPTINLYMPRW